MEGPGLQFWVYTWLGACWEVWLSAGAPLAARTTVRVQGPV